MGKFYSKYEDDYLKQHYHNTLNDELGVVLGRTGTSIGARAFKLGLKKDKEFILKHTMKTAFKKGNIPVNKGKKMSKEMYEKAKPTMFKKGNKPHNFKPVGTKRLTRDGYSEIKTENPNKWELEHRVLWLKHFGEIPDGCNVVFKDGDKTNLSITNLKLIDNVENMLLNSRHNFPKEVIKSKALVCKINNKLKKINNG